MHFLGSRGGIWELPEKEKKKLKEKIKKAVKCKK